MNDRKKKRKDQASSKFTPDNLFTYTSISNRSIIAAILCRTANQGTPIAATRSRTGKPPRHSMRLENACSPSCKPSPSPGRPCPGPRKPFGTSRRCCRASCTPCSTPGNVRWMYGTHSRTSGNSALASRNHSMASGKHSRTCGNHWRTSRASRRAFGHASRTSGRPSGASGNPCRRSCSVCSTSRKHCANPGTSRNTGLYL